MDHATKPAFFPYKPATVLRISGSDAANFLQGQFTNDLRAVDPAAGVYGLWLTQKGRVLADSFVSKSDKSDEFLICSYHSSAAVISERLEQYVIADDVSIEDVTATWSAISLLGCDAETLIPRLPAHVVSFRGRRTSQDSVELLFPSESGEQIEQSLSAAGLSPISNLEIEVLRIESGIPAIPQDVGAADLPNEGGLEVTAISYTKGCYLGQEVMARLKSMGQIRRQLLRVKSDTSSMPALPAPLFLGERKVGELRSAVSRSDGSFLGLAMLSLIHVKSASAFSFAPGELPRVHLLDGLSSR
jgi:tRNA-modifying protein YgfZ